MYKTIGSVPVKSRVPLSRLGICRPLGGTINRIFFGPACCESPSRRALGISIGAGKGSSARQCELVSSASKMILGGARLDGRFLK